MGKLFVQREVDIHVRLKKMMSVHAPKKNENTA